MRENLLVSIDSKVYRKIMHWVNSSDFEVSGFGKVELEDGIFNVTSAVLLKQENSSGSTEIEDAALAKALYELRNEPGHMNFWWHSHVDMAVFWSTTDMKAIETIGKNGWVLATVFNKAEETRSLYYQKGTDFLPSITVDDIATRVSFNSSKEETEEWTEEYNDKVTNTKIPVATSFNLGSFWNDVRDDISLNELEELENARLPNPKTSHERFKGDFEQRLTKLIRHKKGKRVKA